MAQLFDLNIFNLVDTDSSLGVGWTMNFYLTGTTTATDTYPTPTDADAGTNANANPITAAADGRFPVVWLDGTITYKVILKDENGVTLETRDPANIPVTDVTDYTVEVQNTYEGTPGALGWMGGEVFKTACIFPANWSGAAGYIQTNPTSSFVITVKKNGSTVGTITISTGGAYTFATTAGATVSFAVDDRIDYFGPTPADATAADFSWTLKGTAT